MNNRSPKIIGVTGTNGKTSVVHLISSILIKNNIKVLSLGTAGVILNGKWVESSGMTTPPYTYIKKMLLEHQGNFDVVTMELSSHGLEQKRLGDMKIHLGIWTNFTQDHLDYHKTMENYFRAKEKIFKTLSRDAKVIIPQDERSILDKISVQNMPRVETLGEDILQGVHLPKVFRAGFARRNAALAITAAKTFAGITSNNFQFLTMPPGRFEIFRHRQKTVVIDYAHTEDALKNLFKLAKDYFAGKNINLVFGCGGERDVEKRACMGRVAEKYFNRVYLTSDNPRGENPQAIVRDILAGMARPVPQYIDRREAIREALLELDAQSILLIAGKGSEKHQEIGGIKHPFSDMEVVKEVLQND